MKVALIYPPTCDPTAPYLSVPMLTGYLRAHGVEAWPIDANVEAYDRLLRRDALTALAQRLERRLARLERKTALNHVEQLAYAALWQARDAARNTPGAIEDAVAVLRDRSGTRFFDPAQYETAVTTVVSALRVISAAFTPLVLDFTAYRTPFALLTIQEIEADAQPARNPFHAYFQELCADLARASVPVVGISVAFPGQIQPAYALAFMLRRQLPDVHITVGGPAITQILLRLQGAALTNALKPFHSAVLFEGEQALLNLIGAVERGEQPTGLIVGAQTTDLQTLPAPDFDGLPVDKYFAPRLVLPYDPTRGCYWGKCAFCHYGLAACGTARYRERPVALAVKHIQDLAARHNCQIFYFSQDAMSPNMARRLAQALQPTPDPSREGNFIIRWATDMRPEPTLTAECCQTLAAGGALSLALGVESAAPRILSLMQKGVASQDAMSAVTHLAEAGIAVEVMCFTDFPTETYPEASATTGFIEQFRDQIALFICGEFALVGGARVAQYPQEYGLRETWHVSGDELLTSLFYQETTPAKSQIEREALDAALDRLARSWWLHRYPWAGSLSTAHTLLWYARHGPDAFRRFAGIRQKSKAARLDQHAALARRDLNQLFQHAQAHEADIWRMLIHEKRTVTRDAYRQLAHAISLARLKPRRRSRRTKR